MRVVFLYNESAEDPAGFAEDDDPLRSPVVASLERLGHIVTPIACTLDLAGVRAQVKRAAPDVAFNRVESLGGSDAMAAAIAMLLDSMQLPYTGCPTEALVAAAGKISTKERLVAAGLPTPEWIGGDFGTLRVPGISDCGLAEDPSQWGVAKYILKAAYEHASFEMDDSCVIGPASVNKVVDLIREREVVTGKPFFAERFIDGREFNLSLLGPEPQVLPAAEIDFSAFPAGKPRIVGYGAKWDGSSFEFHNTPRRFAFPEADTPLLHELSDLAVRCWRLFGLRGYARVDFRVNAAGRPWILEINTNPCIAPTSGFAAAMAQAKISYDHGIQKILDAAIRSSGVGNAVIERPMMTR